MKGMEPQMKDKEVYTFFTEKSYQDCIDILDKNIDKKYMEGDYIGKVKDDCFTLRFSDANRFSARYNPPKFVGKLLPSDKGTYLEGHFNKPTGFTLFEITMMIVFAISTVCVLFSAIFNIFTSPTNPNYQNSIILFVVAFISLIIGQVVPRIRKGLRNEDRVKILSFLKGKLELTDSICEKAAAK